jgi:hypothetical protein
VTTGARSWGGGLEDPASLEELDEDEELEELDELLEDELGGGGGAVDVMVTVVVRPLVTVVVTYVKVEGEPVPELEGLPAHPAKTRTARSATARVAAVWRVMLGRMWVWGLMNVMASFSAFRQPGYVAATFRETARTQSGRTRPPCRPT